MFGQLNLNQFAIWMMRIRNYENIDEKVFRFTESGQFILNDDYDASQCFLNRKLVINVINFMLKRDPDVDPKKIGENATVEMCFKRVGDSDMGYHCLRTVRTINEVTVNGEDAMNMSEYMRFLFNKVGVMLDFVNIEHLTFVDPIMKIPHNPTMFYLLELTRALNRCNMSAQPRITQQLKKYQEEYDLLKKIYEDCERRNRDYHLVREIDRQVKYIEYLIEQLFIVFKRSQTEPPPQTYRQLLVQLKNVPSPPTKYAEFDGMSVVELGKKLIALKNVRDRFGQPKHVPLVKMNIMKTTLLSLHYHLIDYEEHNKIIQFKSCAVLDSVHRDLIEGIRKKIEGRDGVFYKLVGIELNDDNDRMFEFFTQHECFMENCITIRLDGLHEKIYEATINLSIVISFIIHVRLPFTIFRDFDGQLEKRIREIYDEHKLQCIFV